MASRRARALFFDLDGVLVDSRAPIARSLNHALERQGLRPLPEARLHGFIGAPLRAVCVELLTAQGADPALAERCIEAYRERYGELCLTETRPVKGIAGALARLEAHRPLAVVTSKPVEFARPILARLGLIGRFRDVFGPPLDPQGEAKALTLGRALRALGLRRIPADAAEAVVVGDRQHDVEAGHAHGLTTVGVAWGIGSERELREAGVDHFVETPAELAHLLTAL